VGGSFNGQGSIGGQTRSYIARLDAATGLADGFDPNAGQNGIVRLVATQPDGNILVGGDFLSIGGQTRKALARLDANSGLADSFDSKLGNNNGLVTSVYGLAIQADGKILAGGTFNLAGGRSRENITRLENDGKLDRTLNINTTSDVTALAVQPDGKSIIGGSFTSVLGVPRFGIARLNTDGTLDLLFHSDAKALPNTITVQPDGKILVGGLLDVGGQSRNLARLDATTGIADSFDPHPNDIVWSTAVQPDGKIVVGGDFTSIGGASRNSIARIDGTTGLADSFNPNPNFLGVSSVALQADGKILVGGEFTSIGGQTRHRFARLDPVTGLADSFDPDSTGQVNSIIPQPNGKILVAGDFFMIGGQMRRAIARLDGMTGLADSFNPDPDDFVASIVLQANGKILVSGGFTVIGGQMRNRIARLDPTTSLADSFDPNANSLVLGLSLQSDGKILSAGSFNSIGGQRRRHFARIDNDMAALQDLSVTRTAVTWERAGSSAQFTRVTFEYSTDNVSYALLGAGTLNENQWTLTGLDLPSKHSFYIRARGFYRGGYRTNSESIVESVRNAFLPESTLSPTPTATSTATATPASTATATPTPTPTSTPAPQLLNLSTRMRVQTGDDVGIGGFIITGTSSKHVLLRAIGPSLAQFGVPNALNDPVLELHGPTGFTTIISDNWRDDPVQEALIIASGIPPNNDLEAAIDATLNPGNYTAIVRGQNDTIGVGLVEVYDLNPLAPTKLGNISTRAFVGSGDDILIGGFILGGQNGDDKIVLRGLGPSLTGVPDPLLDPTLELRSGNGTLLALNNNWQDDPAQAAELIAHGLAPSQDLEAAIVTTVSPDLYTVLLEERNGGIGNGLVEIYDLGGGSSPSPSPTATATATATAGGTSATPTATTTATIAPTPPVTPTVSATPTPVPTPLPTCFLFEGFADVVTLPWAGWVLTNHSTTTGTTGWFQGNGAVFPEQSGGVSSFVAANFNNNRRGQSNGDSHLLLHPQLLLLRHQHLTQIQLATGS